MGFFFFFSLENSIYSGMDESFFLSIIMEK
jgi:hypothetical protein